MEDKDLEKMFSEDAGQEEEASIENLGQLSKLAKTQLMMEAEVRVIEQELANANERLKNVREVDIPNLMAEMGIKSFTLDTGAKITIKQDIFASIRKENVDQALAFVDSIGLGGIIKDDVAVKFGKGDSEKAKQLTDFCKEQQFNFTEKLHIHPQTLKATIKEQMEKGVQFPEEYFSIHPFNKSVIKTK